MIETAFISDKGDKRPVNEDRVLCKSYKINGEEWGLFVVADGLGPMGRGSVASQIAVDQLASWWENELSTMISMQSTHGDIIKSLGKKLEKINKKIVDAQSGKMMGTTLSILCIMGDKYFVKHVGDSRIYWLSQGEEITQISEDHSYVAELMRAGEITPEDAKTHPQRNVITRCFGTKVMPKVYSYIGKLVPGDGFLLASDGFYNVVEARTVLGIVKAPMGVEEKVQQLRGQIPPGAAYDNVSVALVMTIA